MVIDRPFSLLKGRFRRLKYLDILRIQEIPTVTIVACTLHNICLDNGDPYEDFMGEMEEEVNSFENILPPGCGAEDKRNELISAALLLAVIKINCNLIWNILPWRKTTYLS